MKKKILIFSIVSLFVLISLSGCDELDFETENYIVVTINCGARVYVERGDPNIGANLENLGGAEVKIDMVKAGGETKTFYRTTTSEFGYITPVEGTFNLYKEQPITVYATVYSTPVGYEDVSWPMRSKTWTWDQIYPSMADFGGSTTLYFTPALNGV